MLVIIEMPLIKGWFYDHLIRMVNKKLGGDYTLPHHQSLSSHPSFFQIWPRGKEQALLATGLAAWLSPLREWKSLTASNPSNSVWVPHSNLLKMAVFGRVLKTIRPMILLESPINVIFLMSRFFIVQTPIWRAKAFAWLFEVSPIFQAYDVSSFPSWSKSQR